MAVPNPVSTNPWANPWVGGPNQINTGITGIDALDGLLRGWIAVESVQQQKKLSEAQLRQQSERETVTRNQQPGATPIPAGAYGITGAGGGFDNQTLLLIGLGVLAFVALS